MSNTTNTSLDEVTTMMYDVTSGVDALLNVTASIARSGKMGNAWMYFVSIGAAWWIADMAVVVLGLLGNSMMMVLMSEVKFSSLSNSVFLRFLALSDSLVLILKFVEETLKFFKSFYVVGDKVAVCSLFEFLAQTVMLLSPWLVVALTIDSFFCVVFPLKRGALCTRKRALVVCLCLTAITVAMTLPLISWIKTLKGADVICIVVGHMIYYNTVLRLLFNNALPCLAIMVFTILTRIHVWQTPSLKTTPTRVSASSGSSNIKEGKSYRPVCLISVFSVATIIPLLIPDTAVMRFATQLPFKTLALFLAISKPVNIVYLFNFGKNFYILMASSANCRSAIRSRLKCGRRTKIRTQITYVNADLLESHITHSAAPISPSVSSDVTVSVDAPNDVAEMPA